MAAHADAVRRLQISDAITDLEFYSFVDGTGTQVGVRIYGGIHEMDWRQAEELAKELNAATLDVRSRLAERYKMAAIGSLVPAVDPATLPTLVRIEPPAPPEGA